MLQTPPVSPCTHERREHLGTESRAEFYRCRACGAVLVVQGRRVWQILSREAAASLVV